MVRRVNLPSIALVVLRYLQSFQCDSRVVNAEVDALGSYFPNHLTGFDRDRSGIVRGCPALGTAFQLAGDLQNLWVQTGQMDKDGRYFAGVPDDNPVVFQSTRIALGSRPEGESPYPNDETVGR